MGLGRLMGHYGLRGLAGGDLCLTPRTEPARRWRRSLPAHDQLDSALETVSGSTGTWAPAALVAASCAKIPTARMNRYVMNVRECDRVEYDVGGIEVEGTSAPETAESAADHDQLAAVAFRTDQSPPGVSPGGTESSSNGGSTRHGRGFHPDRSVSRLKCVLVMNGSER